MEVEGGSSPCSSSSAFGQDVEHRAIVLREIRPRRALDVGRRQVLENVDLRVRAGDVVVDHRGMRQVKRLLLVGLAADDVVAHELVLRAVQLMARHGGGLQVFELREQRLFDGFRGLTGRNDRHRVEQVRVLEDVRAAERRDRDALVVDEVARDPRALPVEQDLRRQVQRVRIWMTVVRDVIRDDHRRQRPFLLDDGATLLRLFRLLGDVVGHRFGGLRHATEVLRDELHGLRRVEVTDERHDRVFRHVIGVVEIAHVVERRRLEILHAADRRVLVRVAHERFVEQDLVEASVRLVVDTQPPLLLDNLDFFFERVAVDAKRRHPIGLEPQGEGHVLRRQRFPEHRGVFLRIRVAASADACDDRRVRLGLHVLRALEHHVLEQMRKPGSSRLLVSRADVVPHGQMHDRRRMILGQDHAQPVRQRSDLVLEFWRMDGGMQRHDEGASRRGEQDEQTNQADHISMIWGRTPFRLMKWHPSVSATHEPEPCAVPAHCRVLKRVRVDAPFSGHNQFDGAPLPFEPQTGFPAGTALHASIPGAVDPDQARAACRDRADMRMQRHTYGDSAVCLPAVVDARFQQHAEQVALRANLHRPVACIVCDARPEHVPIDRAQFETVAEMARRVMKQRGNLDAVRAQRGREIEEVVALVWIEAAKLLAEHGLVVDRKGRAAAAIVDQVHIAAEVRVPDEPRIVARQVVGAQVEVETRKKQNRVLG